MSDLNLFNDKTPELLALTDPASLQAYILGIYEKNLNRDKKNETYVITDPHNVFTSLIEMSSVIGAELALSAHNELSSQSAYRAQTMKDLYKHMSDYDYVGLFATPCNFEFQLTLDKTHLKENSIEYNQAYSKIIIPKNTVFKLGKYYFGLHYPIELRINNKTSNVIAMYDTSVNNPLQELQTHLIEVYEQTFQQQEYVTLIIPVEQFARSYFKETLVSGHGFTKSYNYNYQFYALRLYTEVNGKTVELKQTYTESIYDPGTVTAKIMVSEEKNSFTITIPQIYFNSGKIGKELFCELFTTEGALDIDVTNLDDYKSDVNFNLKDIGYTDKKYSECLSKNPHIDIQAPLTKLVGGSDGLTFDEVKDRVMHNTFHPATLVTPMDLTARFSDKGFTVKKHLDNFTKRIYYAYKLLTDSVGVIIHTKDCVVKIEEETIDEVSTIIENIDNSITILPTTLYEYSTTSNSCTPLSDEKVNFLKNLPRESFIEEMNSHIYTKYPFHLRLIRDDKYSRCSSYNLMNPITKKFTFIKENENLTAQMVTAGGRVYHEKEGIGGYKIQLLVKKTDDLKDIPEENLLVYIYTRTLDGIYAGIEAKLVDTYSDQFIYEFAIETNYMINENDALGVTNLNTNDGNLFYHILPLETTFYILFLIKNEVFPGTSTDNSMYEGILDKYKSDYICTVKQSFVVRFGENVDDVIHNNVEPVWSSRRYLTRGVDKPLTYPQDVYLKDSTGFIVTPLELIHKRGDIVLDEQGEPTYEYRKGDVTIGSDGMPIIEKESTLIYLINVMMLDAKIYASEHPTQIKYRNNLTSNIMSYLSTLRQEKQHLLEQTELYFKPLNTIGNAKYSIGNGEYVTQPLDSVFDLRLHVPKYVSEDAALRESLENSTTEILEQDIADGEISLTDTANKIKEKLSDYVVFIDILGINGKTNLQTMIITDTDSQPSVAANLTVNRDGELIIKKHVNIEFVYI